MTTKPTNDSTVENIHLDTTIMTDWLLKGHARRDQINGILAKYVHSTTSRYVKSEFKRTPLQYLVYLHNKLCQVQSVGQLFEAISKLPLLQSRRLHSILEQFTGFFTFAMGKLDEQAKVASPVSHGEYLLQIGRSYFANLIEESWQRFDDVADEVIDPQFCFPDMVGPKREGNLFSNAPRTCDKSTIRCGCRRFYSDQEERLRTLLAALRKLHSPDEETRRRIHSIHEILRKPKRLREEDCWKCGDATVACEAVEGSAIFNNNMKHFGPICSALGLPTVTY